MLSKGKTVHFGSHKFVASGDHKQTLSFLVTDAMVPSVRILVYYILHGEGTSELVADSVWLKVTAPCVGGLQVGILAPSTHTQQVPTKIFVEECT